jgi:acetyl-CoA acetyltransferase
VKSKRTGSSERALENGSPLTDGSACVLIGNALGAEKLGIEPLAKLIDVQVAAVDFVRGAGLLMGPNKGSLSAPWSE